jgi:hypothetical protein
MQWSLITIIKVIQQCYTAATPADPPPTNAVATTPAVTAPSPMHALNIKGAMHTVMSKNIIKKNSNSGRDLLLYKLKLLDQNFF